MGLFSCTALILRCRYNSTGSLKVDLVVGIRGNCSAILPPLQQYGRRLGNSQGRFDLPQLSSRSAPPCIGKQPHPPPGPKPGPRPLPDFRRSWSCLFFPLLSATGGRCAAQSGHPLGAPGGRGHPGTRPDGNDPSLTDRRASEGSMDRAAQCYCGTRSAETGPRGATPPG